MDNDRASLPVAHQPGVLIDHQLEALLALRGIITRTPLAEDQLQPSSLDLRLFGRIWQVQCSFLPGRKGVMAQLERLAIHKQVLHPERPTILHCGGVYLAELDESLELPPEFFARVNPKSSTGRLDVFVRLLTETGDSFDTVPAGYRGRLFLEIAPQSFHIMVRQGDALAQLRVIASHHGPRGPRLDRAELLALHAERGILLDDAGNPISALEERIDQDGLLLSVDLVNATGGTIGYRAMSHRPPVDLRRRDYEIPRFWNRLRSARDVGHVLEPERFYLFATDERLRIPPEVSAELVPFDPTKGELRTHYAGFVDSGFGWSDGAEDGSVMAKLAGRGAKLVLEIRTHDVPFLLEHGQRLFRLEFWRNLERPRALYGRELASHYQGQGLRLSKQFGRGESSDWLGSLIGDEVLETETPQLGLF